MDTDTLGRLRFETNCEVIFFPSNLAHEWSQILGIGIGIVLNCVDGVYGCARLPSG